MATNIKRFSIFLVVTVALLWVLSTFNRATLAQLPINLAERAKLEISQLTNIPPNRLTIVNQTSLADTGITQFKIIDPENRIYGVSLDAAGNTVSQEVIEQALQAFDNRGFVGKLEEELATLLTQGSNNPIEIIISVKEEGVERSWGRTRAEQQARLNYLRTRYAEIQQPLVNYLKANGQQVTYQSLFSSTVVASVTPSLIPRIAERPDVVRIYLDREGSLR